MAGHSAKYTGNGRAMEMSRHRYSQALSLLRDRVSCGTGQVTAEVVAATKILMLYEYVSSPKLSTDRC